MGKIGDEILNRLKNEKSELQQIDERLNTISTKTVPIKNNYSNYYKLDIYLNDGKVISTTSFLDTGNNLFDPYFNRPIILIDKNLIKDDYNYKDILLVPYDTIDSHGILKCLKVNYIYILGIGIRRNVLIGISNKKIMIDGVDSILNRRILEEEI